MQIGIFGKPEAFEWDLDKADLNAEKHQISFEDAIRVFEQPTLDSLTLRRGELRAMAIGVVDGVEVMVVYAIRGTTFRIISARKASKDEREAYRAVFT
jgi:uncharacterized protein